MRYHMKGKELDRDELESLIDRNNVSGIINMKPAVKNVPTMQVGHNDDGTIKEIEINPKI